MGTYAFYDKTTCGTCKKAKTFLENAKVNLEIHDIVKDPPAKDVLEQLIDPKNVKASLNIRSTIYKEKNLGDNIPSKNDAIRLMLTDPNLIKRPVIVSADGRIYQGFDETTLKAFIKK